MSLAVIACERGALERAASLTVEVLEMCREIVDSSATAVRCVEIASNVLVAGGAAAPATRLIAAATAQREALGAPVPPQEQVEQKQALIAAHAALRPSDFERAWADGGRLSILEAVGSAVESLTGFVESRSL